MYIIFVSLATTCKSSQQTMENMILDSIYMWKTCLFNFQSSQIYYFQKHTYIWILPGYDQWRYIPFTFTMKQKIKRQKPIGKWMMEMQNFVHLNKIGWD